jgi:glycosyltransferase involved in cell wall biosynthesis
VRVVAAANFFPRGGSSHVARELARQMVAMGWEVTLVSGSRTDLGPAADAGAFYSGLDVRPVDFTSALGSPDPMLFDGGPGSAPMHPSFEDRPSSPDRLFAKLDDECLELQVSAWARELERARADKADVLHLHHITPIHEAARRAAPDVPVVGQVHGTELLMLEEIAAGPPEGWEYAGRWVERMRGWAARCERILAAPANLDRVVELLGVERDRLLPTPNGFDPALFRPRKLDRGAHWRRHLASEPQGWAPGGEPGSVSYAPEQLETLTEGPVILYVGRFTEVKRIGVLIRAFARARASFRTPASLVILGGYPGEWEGEHPAEAIAASGAENVFLAGWHGHDELPAFLNASDALAMPSVRESFGQVMVEAMACARPVISARTFSSVGIVDDGVTGWLVPPDDIDGMSAALTDVVNDPEERERRGAAARDGALERFSWPSIAARVAEVLGEAAARKAPSG